METDKKWLDENIPQYLKQLVNLAWDTQNAMFNYEQETERPYIDIEIQEKSKNNFKMLLQRLFYRYEPKFKNSSVNISKEVKKELENGKSVINLDIETAKTLCTDIRDLMEDIGHTSFSKNVHKDKKLGGK